MPIQKIIMKTLHLISKFIFGVLILSAALSCNSKQDKSTLIVFHAGSLSKPLQEMVSQFEQNNPGSQILLEAAGSRECARKITELHKPCDIMASSDYTVIQEMLIPEYTNWFIDFATNEMCIAYTENSKAASVINAENWVKILLADSVTFGRSNPDLDPCGYRTIMLFELAELYLNEANLYSGFLSKDINYIRPKEVDLLALLESNVIDYIFIYKSVAIQHHLKVLDLPDEINLGNPEFTDFYKNASVEITGKVPGSTAHKTGEPMIYAFTILKDAPNTELAEQFATFMLNPEQGQKIMEQNGQQSMARVPDEYRKYIPNKIFKELSKTDR